MSENVYWLLLLAVTPGRFDDLKSLMTEMVEATQRNEIRALDYEWAISEDRGVCDRLRTVPRFRSCGTTLFLSLPENQSLTTLSCHRSTFWDERAIRVSFCCVSLWLLSENGIFIRMVLWHQERDPIFRCRV